MFRGRYETTVDAKGRTSLPAKFRDVLVSCEDERMVVTTGLEPCLVAYPYSEWRQFEERLAALPTFDANVVKLKRFYVGNAVECPTDSHGRILIPQNLREYAGIQKNVVWCGMVGHVEIWDQSRFEKVSDNTKLDAGEFSTALAGLGL